MRTESPDLRRNPLMMITRSSDIAPRRHALTIFEVLKTIFGHLGEHDLARVSRVCRWWSSTALNLLWRSIRNLTVLIKTGYPMRYVSRIGVGPGSPRCQPPSTSLTALSSAVRLGSLRITQQIVCGMLLKDMHCWFEKYTSLQGSLPLRSSHTSPRESNPTTTAHISSPSFAKSTLFNCAAAQLP